jgi:MerR family transcriptional regulator, light-induced transcriptional regulator
MSRDEPIYNIGVVERMIDIPAATLRVWERRYGFPDTARTEGGHRLYSDADIEQLKWVKRKVDAGMQTRQAVRALQSLLEEEGTVVPQPQPDTRAAFGVTPAVPFEESRGSSYLALLQRRLFNRLSEHQIDEADDVFNEALALYAPEDVILHIIRPTLSQVGTDWALGEMTIGTEHLASHYLRQRLLVWLRAGPPPFAVQPTVLACAPGEYHEGSLMILGALLRRRRWPIAYLGQSIPLPDLAEFVRETDPLAVALVAMTEKPAQALVSWPEYLPEASESGRPLFCFGGRIFNQQPEWRARLPGLFLGATLTEGVQTLERALRSVSGVSMPEEASRSVAGSGDE